MSQPLSYRQLTAPVIEPLSLAQAKSQCVVSQSFTDDDDLLSGYIVSARQYCEGIMNRCIFNRNMQMTLDYFPYPQLGSTINPNDRHPSYSRYTHEFSINLPMPGCVSVTSITYLDSTMTLQTLPPTAYYVDVNSEPARIVPIPYLSWPYCQNLLPGNITILWEAGTYGDGVTINLCPMPIVQAMQLLVSFWYNHRDSAESNPPKAIEDGVRALLAPYYFDGAVNN
jgi:hypothetical protein